MAPKTQTALNPSGLEAPVAFRHPAESTSQPLVEVLCDLIDCVSKKETLMLTPLTENGYQQLAARLDDLIDIVGQDENHLLVPLIEFVATLIKKYEDEHVPKLTEI